MFPPVAFEVANAVYFCGAVLAPAIAATPGEEEGREEGREGGMILNINYILAVGVDTAAAVTTSHKPFTIHFHTDYTEVTATAEDGNTDIGFSISYSQVAC